MWTLVPREVKSLCHKYLREIYRRAKTNFVAINTTMQPRVIQYKLKLVLQGVWSAPWGSGANSFTSPYSALHRSGDIIGFLPVPSGA